MSRAALLPTPGDPFILLMWFRFFEEVWQDEVDKLYIHINGPLEEEVKNSLIKIISKNPKVVISNDDTMIDHGTALTKLVNACTEDYVVLMEDDAPIIKSGYINQYFNIIENGKYDAVTSPRGCTRDPLIQAINLKFKLGSDPTPNFWPCFGFFKREHLLKTDQNFKAVTWQAGEKIEELDWVVDELTSGDTFVWASIQLRAQGLKFLSVEQYHRSPYDLRHVVLKIGVFDGVAPWFHIGSLSGMVYTVLTKDYPLPITSDENLKLEYSGRIFWLEMCLDYTQRYWDEILNEFSEVYKIGLMRFISEMCLNRSVIRQYMKSYKDLIGINT